MFEFCCRLYLRNQTALDIYEWDIRIDFFFITVLFINDHQFHNFKYGRLENISSTMLMY